jgi:hypothetical protein
MLKSPPAPQTVAREAQDVRERRDVDRLDFHLVSPIPPVSRPVVPDVQAIAVLLWRNGIPTASYSVTVGTMTMC